MICQPNFARCKITTDMTESSSYRAANRPFALLPMAGVVLFHLVIVSLWMANSAGHLAQDSDQRHFTLIWLRSPAPVREAPPAPAARGESPARPRIAPARDALPVITSPAAEKPATGQSATPEESTEAPVTTDAINTGQLMETARRQVGAIDRAMQDSKTVPFAADPKLPISRLRVALESAHIDRAYTTVTESFTQADGVIVYRMRRGSKVWCRQSGGMGPGMMERSEGAKMAGAGSAGGAGAAGTIVCPTGDVGWSRL